MSIRIVADSGSDLLKETAEKHNIEIVPLKVQFGEEVFVDGIDIDNKSFYRKMAESEEIPITALPSPHDFMNTFQKIGPENEIICITISSVTSGTNQSAHMAKEMLPEYKIEIIDSLHISMSTGMLALNASKMAQEGRSMEEIIDSLEILKRNMNTFIAIDDLENVIKGGRISNWKGTIAKILNIKPTLYLTPKGEIHIKETSRGRKKQLKGVLELIEMAAKDLTELPLYILHAMASEKELDYLQAEINKRFNPREIIIYPLGPIMGSHGGFGAIGIAF